MLPTYLISNVRVTAITVAMLHDYIASAIKGNQRVPVLHANAHAINLAYRDADFRAVLNAAPVVFCDGFGVRLGARLLGHRLPPRITYADWMYQLAPFCEQHRFSLYLLGSAPGIAEQAAQNLRGRYANLKVVGTHHGYFSKNGAENDAVIEAINVARPDVLLVGFGMPLQEKWIAANLDRLDTHVVLSAGAALDYVAGNVRRGPKWMTDNGLEWLARLLIEPQRLWRRYVLGNPQFLWLVLKQWWRGRTQKYGS